MTDTLRPACSVVVTGGSRGIGRAIVERLLGDVVELTTKGGCRSIRPLA